MKDKSSGKRKFKGALTSEKYYEGIESCLGNAKDLLEESRILFDHKKYSRSYFLTLTCVEELGKINLLLGLMIFPNSQTEARESAWREFYKHDEKFKRVAEIIIVMNRIVDKNFDPTEFMQATLRIEFERMDCLYVEFKELKKTWHNPSNFISESDAKGILELAGKLYEHYGKWKDSISPQVVDVVKKYIEKFIDEAEIKEERFNLNLVMQDNLSLCRELFGEMFVELAEKKIVKVERLIEISNEVKSFASELQLAKKAAADKKD